MTRTVQRLERAGLVRRRRDARDGRVTLVESTSVGLALRAQIESIWAELEKDTIGALSASQQRQLIRSLNLLEANLAEASGGGGA
jgi:DNA-binding MarR family transcriptional regulator